MPITFFGPGKHECYKKKGVDNCSQAGEAHSLEALRFAPSKKFRAYRIAPSQRRKPEDGKSHDPRIIPKKVKDKATGATI